MIVRTKILFYISCFFVGGFLSAVFSGHFPVFLSVGHSMPAGIYLSSAKPDVGTAVIVYVSDRQKKHIKSLYPHFDGPLFKFVAASSGDVVCRYPEKVLLHSEEMSTTLSVVEDVAHIAPLGCRKLLPLQLFVVGSSDRSFDSRYIGVVSADNVARTFSPAFE